VTKPNTFIIGAPKSGTTSLVHYLKRHPDVFFSNLKEPGFWATDFPWLARRNALPTQDSYLELFRSAGQARVVGEASTMYLISETAASNIVEFNAQARLIVMLRNPVEVARAYHMQKLLVFQEDQADFESAWKLQAARQRGECVPANCPDALMLQYGSIPRFGVQVERLLQRVSRESILFVRYEDFKRDPRAVYRNVLRFLQLPDDDRDDFPVFGAARAHRFPLIGKLFHNPPALVRYPMRALHRHLVRKRYPLIEKLKRSLYRNQPRKTPSPELQAEMLEHFRPDVLALERLLGWNLQDWLRLPAAGR
jgi:hypothetical protein